MATCSLPFDRSNSTKSFLYPAMWLQV
jgi:hypothetical protein